MRKQRKLYDRPKPLPKRCLTILVRLRQGERLCRSFRQRQTGDETLWWLEPSGQQCGPASARRLTATPMLVPCAPGLFGGGLDAQSWVYAP